MEPGEGTKFRVAACGRGFSHARHVYDQAGATLARSQQQRALTHPAAYEAAAESVSFGAGACPPCCKEY